MHANATPVGRLPRPEESGFSDLMMSEWIKLITLPSTWGALIGMILLGIVGAVLSGFRYFELSVIREPDVALTMYDVTMVAGALCPVFVGIIGVISLGAEYSSGSAQSTFLATPRRLQVLAAKATVLFATVAVAAAVMIFGAWSASYPLYARFGLEAPLSSEVLSALLGVVFYLALVSVFGLGIAALVRSTTAGAIIIFTATFLVPGISTMLPPGLTSTLIRAAVIGNGGFSMVAYPISDAPFWNTQGYLSPTAGYLIVIVWTLIAVVAGAIALRRRGV
ncbi:hypothetical protein ACR5KS_00700 [Leucobacter sp. W1153]|uniref:hypothetical protein n=1 Tax=Leucobacter sp. W1153 TaxID=3439064 RepID=UPI003F3FEFEA